MDLPITTAKPEKNPILESRMINPRTLPLQGRKNVEQAVVGSAGQGTHASGVSTGRRQLDLIEQQLYLEKALVEGLGVSRRPKSREQHQL